VSGPRPAFVTATLGVCFVHRDARRRDLDNDLAGCKALLDCLVAEGVLLDDDAAHLTRITVTRRVDRRAGVTPHVELTLTEVSP
jgi:Holliday junction resolvase RusA-like endonuclease